MQISLPSHTVVPRLSCTVLRSSKLSTKNAFLSSGSDAISNISMCFTHFDMAITRTVMPAALTWNDHRCHNGVNNSDKVLNFKTVVHLFVCLWCHICHLLTWELYSFDDKIDLPMSVVSHICCFCHCILKHIGSPISDDYSYVRNLGPVTICFCEHVRIQQLQQEAPDI